MFADFHAEGSWANEKDRMNWVDRLEGRTIEQDLRKWPLVSSVPTAEAESWSGRTFSTFSGEKDTESRMQGVWGWGKMGTEQGGLLHDVWS